MKKIALTIVMGCAVFVWAACNQPKELNMAQVHQLEDSIPHLVPGASTIHTLVEQNTQLKVIVGDVSFYDAPADKKQAAAQAVGRAALHIFGKDISEGQLIITKDLNNSQGVPADGVATDMQIDAQKKSMGLQ